MITSLVCRRETAAGSSRLPVHSGCTSRWRQLELASHPTAPPLVSGHHLHLDQECVVRIRREAPQRPNRYRLVLTWGLSSHAVRVNVGGQSFSLPRDRYVVINPREDAYIEPHRKGYTAFQMSFHQPFLRWCRELIHLPSQAGPFDFDVRPRALTPALRAPLQDWLSWTAETREVVADVWRPHLAFGAGLKILALLWQQHPNGLRDRLEELGYRSATDPRMEKALAYLTAHVGAPVDNRELAAAAGVSASNLYPLFRKAFGKSPRDVLNDLRVARANQLMTLDPTRSWEDIARQVGFARAWSLKRLIKSSTRPSS